MKAGKMEIIEGNVMIQTIAVLISLLVPIVIALILITFRPQSRLEWVMAAWFSVAFSLFYFLTGAWFLLSIYARYAIFGLVLASVIISFFRLPKEMPFADFSVSRSRFQLVSYLVPALLFSGLSVAALVGRTFSGPAVSLAFPLKDGQYYIAQAGGTSLVNAHHAYGSQIYALDIIGLNSLGRNAEGLSQTALTQYAIFGAKVLSPCSGTIAAAVDGLDDLQPGAAGDRLHPAGNHVYIECRQENVDVLLAHMQKGSLVVKQGDPVVEGEHIGNVGNSGNTSEPHLHIHARKGGDLDQVIGGMGVPILFEGRFLVRNDIWP